ncbi:MAG: hypothetical protein N3F66_04245 [Spirochaetes bacterium]|nr:hypothetical protein [Spirochaetota bacterium]
MRHNNCYYCGQNGFIFRSYRFEDMAIVADVKIEKKHEGWPGIPHGGLAMTTFIELIDIAKEYPALYPHEYRFRFAGERLMCGDVVRCIVNKGDARYYFGTFGKSLQLPYCNCRYSEEHVHSYRGEIVEILKNNMDASTPFIIPNMSTKLINTSSGQHEQRVFYITDYKTDRTYLISHLSGDNNFVQTSDGYVHNGVLSSLLDETMGWSTFLSVWQAGVTVELQITFYDRVSANEAFHVIGFCDDVRGEYGKKITTAYGGVIALRDGGLAIIALAYGRWLTLPGFKELMIQYLKHYSE